MQIIFQTEEGSFIKSWPNVEYFVHGIPMSGDHVFLHFGDKGEESEEYVVVRRVFDGLKSDSVYLIVMAL